MKLLMVKLMDKKYFYEAFNDEVNGQKIFL